jgi:hypothetical protein
MIFRKKLLLPLVLFVGLGIVIGCRNKSNIRQAPERGYANGIVQNAESHPIAAARIIKVEYVQTSK